MPSVEITERDLRRDEARLVSILTGGPALAEAELPTAAAPRRPRVPAWLAALVLTGATAAAGVGLRSLVEPLVRRVPTAPQSLATAQPIPLPVPTPSPVASSTGSAAPVAQAEVEPAPRPIHTPTAEHLPRPRRTREAEAPGPPASPPPAAPSRPVNPWIAEPLYGEALERARAADAARTRDLNRGELGRLPPPPAE